MSVGFSDYDLDDVSKYPDLVRTFPGANNSYAAILLISFSVFVFHA